MLHNLFNCSVHSFMNLNNYRNFSSTTRSLLLPIFVSNLNNYCSRHSYHQNRYHQYYCRKSILISPTRVSTLNTQIQVSAAKYSSSTATATSRSAIVGQLRAASALSVSLPASSVGLFQYSHRNSTSRSTFAHCCYYSTTSSNSTSRSSSNTKNSNSNNNSSDCCKSPSRVLTTAASRQSQSQKTSSSLLLPNSNNNLITPSGYSRSVVTSPRIKIIEMEPQQQQHQQQEKQALLGDPRLLTKEEQNDFNSSFSIIVQALTENSEMRDMTETNRWLARVLHYNVPHGKKNRGLATALAYKFMAKELTEENLQLSYILGWCVEMLQAFFLVADDIMDRSETRRGHPCWYKVDNLGPAAFNDAILLETSIYVLLTKYFRNKDYYVDLLEIFHDATNKTTFGQSLDTRTGLQRNMEEYTMELYSAIVKYKTSYYSFTLPVALAMAMAGIHDSELRRQARTVTLEMGHFFQIQDDYLDCFGDEEETGKIGTDIQDCKCSWLFVQALQHASTQQRETLLANYGQDEPSKIQIIKQVYAEMELEQLYKDFEEQSYNTISTHILQMSPELPKSLFMDMLHKIYKRSS